MQDNGSVRTAEIKTCLQVIRYELHNIDKQIDALYFVEDYNHKEND